MATVDQMIEDIIRREGGYVNHPADRGGPTNWGITRATLSKWMGRSATVKDVQDLSRETVALIYKKLYFDDAGIDAAPDALQAQLFDINVNGGLAPVVERVGPLDELVQKHGGRVANIVLAASRMEYYRRVVANRPSQGAFFKGWINRAMEFVEWQEGVVS